MRTRIQHTVATMAAAGMACAALLTTPAGAVPITVKDPDRKPGPTVMVSRPSGPQ